MTQMIYRPETQERHFEGQALIKTPFRNIQCDALIVDEDDVEAFVEKGWFAHPNEMFTPDPQPEPEPEPEPEKSKTTQRSKKS